MSRRLRALIVAAAALGLGAAAGTAATAAYAPADLALRLSDLGPGYEMDDPSCDPLELEGGRAAPQLRGLAMRFPNRGCQLGFRRRWTVPGAPPSAIAVTSTTFVFRDTAGPAAAILHPRAIASLLLGAPIDDYELADQTPQLGDQATMLRTADGYTVTVWRSGSVLASVAAASRRVAVADEAALRLSAAQQARIVTPTKLRPGENDDLAVTLDDPRLGVPVYWLGRHVPADRGRPPLKLLDDPLLSTGRFQPRVDLNYSAPGGRSGVDVALWKPRTLRRAFHADAQRGICFRRFDGRIANAHATIYGSYEPPRRRCEPGPPEVLSAVAFFDGVAVTLDASGCYGCGGRRAPYDSVAGLRILLRTLQPRTPAP